MHTKALKTLGRFILSSVFFLYLFSSVLFAWSISSVSPSKITQGDEEVRVTIYLSTVGEGLEEPTTGPKYEPSFTINGCSVGDEAIYHNEYEISRLVKVPRNAPIGNATVTVTGRDDNNLLRMTPWNNIGAITSQTTTIQIVSKPMILSCSPAETYQKASQNIIFYGNYFDTSGNSTISITEAGVIGTPTTPTATSVTQNFNLSSGKPGGPFKIAIVSNDKGVGWSEDGQGNPVGIFTLYPKPTITSVEKNSVYQGEQSVQLRIRGTGFHATSSLKITTDAGGTQDSGGLEIISVQPNPASGDIAVTVNVDRNATTGPLSGTLGDRYFWVINPDGQSGTNNTSSGFSKADFVTYKFIPTINPSSTVTTTAAAQGFSGEITITAQSSDGIAFDAIATPEITFDSDDITVTSVVFVDTSTLRAYIKVQPTAELGDRTVTVKNPTYKTQGTYKFEIYLADEAKLENATLSLDTNSLYQGDVSTVTITCNGAAFETGATVKVGGEKLEVKNVTYISSTTLWCYIEVDPTVDVGDRTLTVENPTYKVQKSTIITVSQSPYNKLKDSTITPDHDTLYLGTTDQLILNVTGGGKIEQGAEVTIGGTGVTLNSFVLDSSETSLTLNLKILSNADVGMHPITINNKTYGVSVSTSVTVVYSEESNPTITSASKTTLFKNRKYEVVINGTGFSDNATFSFVNPDLKVLSSVVKSSVQAVVFIEVPDAVEEGYYSFKITNPSFNASYVKQDLFLIKGEHQIDEVLPAMIAPGTTEYFYINGKNFDMHSDFTISIDSKVATAPFIFVSSKCVSHNQISCQIYIMEDVIGKVHDVGVYFTSVGSTVTKREAFSVPTKPEITNIPSTLSQGDINKEVTIQGKNFESGAIVVISGSGIIISSTSFISSNIMTFRCDVTKEAEKTDRTVKVINPTGQFSTGTVRVISPPIIVSCNPSTVLKGTSRYLEILGENFGEFFDLSFSTITTQVGEADREDAINILELDYAGNTQISARVYIGTHVVNGRHDITIVTYEDDAKTLKESEGIGNGILNVRTPLTISNAEGEYTVPANFEGKVILIKGEGFSETSTVEISGSGITITNLKFINSQELEIVINVSPEATLGKRTVTVKETDGSSAYKQLLEVIAAIQILEVIPDVIPVGLNLATMVVTGSGIDIAVGSTITVNGVQGWPAEGIVDILGGGVEDVIISTATSDSIKLYFEVLDTAKVGTRDLRITNKDGENVIEKAAAFRIEEQVKVYVFTPSQYQITTSLTDFKITGAGFNGNFTTDGSTITFSESRLEITQIDFTDDDEISGKFKWSGTGDILNRSVDITVKNKDGSLGTLEGGLYLLEPLEIIETLISPTSIPINAENVVINIRGKGIIEGATAYLWTGTIGSKDTSQIRTTAIEYISSEELFITVKTSLSLSSGTLVGITVANPNNTAEVNKQDVFMLDNIPAINSITPSSVRVGGVVSVVIAGYNFLTDGGLKSIDLSHGAYITTTSITNTQITGTITAPDTASSGDLTVSMETNNNGKIGTALKLFTVLEGPIINEVIPSTLYAEKAGQTYINGENYDEGVTIVVKNLETGSTEYVEISTGTEGLRRTSTRLIIESLKINKEGEYSLEVINPDGSSILLSKAFLVYPVVSQAQVTTLSPPYGARGEIDKEIKAEGANFLEGMTIYTEGAGITITSSTFSYSTATIKINIAANATPGEHNIVFLNPNSTATKVKFYVITTPVITSVVPGSIQRGTTTEIRIVGENFIEDGGAEGGTIDVDVNVAGITVWDSSTTFISSQQLNAYITIDDTVKVGPRDVTVTNPFGSKGTGWGVLRIVAPITVSSIEPGSVAQGDTDRTLLVNGTGFEEGATVAFTGSGITVNKTDYVADFQLSLNVTIKDDAFLGSRGIKITNPDSSPVTVNNALTITPKVVVERTNPSKIGRGVEGVSGNGVPIEIIGSNFDPSTNTVEISGAGITIKSIVTNGQNSVIAYLIIDENAVLGKRDITVITANGSKGEGTAILEIVDVVGVNNVDPSIIPIYKDAFAIYFSTTGAITSAQYEVTSDSMTLYHNGLPAKQIALAGNNVTQIITEINTYAVGWQATEINTQAGHQDATYLKIKSQTEVLNSTKTVEFSTNGLYTPGGVERYLIISGEGFSAASSTPIVLFTGDGITVIHSSTTVTSSDEIKTKILIDPFEADLGKRDIKVKNADGTTSGWVTGLLELVEPLKVFGSTPNKLGKGSENVVLRILGQGFSNGLKVEAESGSGVTVSNIEYIGSEEIRIETTIPISFAGSISTYTVTNPNTDTAKLYLPVESIPVVSSILPEEVGQGASTTITMSGYALEDVDSISKVLFSGTDITVVELSSVTATEIKAIINVSKSAQLGFRDLTITDASLKVGKSADILRVVSAPTLTSIDPASILPGATITVTINGSGFKYGVQLSFTTTDLQVLEYNYSNNSRFRARIYASSAAVPGLYDATVTNPDLSSGLTFGAMEILEPPKDPQIVEVIPAKMALGSTNQPLIINGYNFEDGAVVTFSGSEVTITSKTVTPNQIQLEVSVAAGGTILPGSRRVTVINPSGKKEARDDVFALVALPVITAVQPETLTQGTTVTVFLTGSGFIEGPTLSISNNPGMVIRNVEVIGTSHISFDLEVATDAVLGNHDIDIITDNGSGKGVGLLKIVAPLEIDYVSPNILSKGVEGRDLWIYGKGFEENSNVVITGGGITINRIYYISEKQLRAVVNIDESAILGDRKITVYNESGAKYEKDGIFAVIPPVTVIGVQPNEIGVGAINKEVIITGTEFKSGARLKFSGSGIDISTVIYHSDTKLTAIVSVSQDALAGARNVVVINTDGNEGTGENLLFIEESVKVNSVDPRFFTLTPGTTYQAVTIRGTGFRMSEDLTQAPTVLFSATAISVDPGSLTFESSEELRAIVIIDTTIAKGGTTSDVTVTNSDGTTGLGKDLYFLTDPLKITNITPTSLGQGSQNQDLTILGQGFIDGATLSFTDSEIVVNSLDYMGDKEIKANISVGITATIGNSSFTITNPGGLSITTDSFKVSDAPVVFLANPSEYARGATNQSLDIHGIGFSVINTTVTISGGVNILSKSIVAGSTESVISLTINIDKNASIGDQNITIVSDGKTGVGTGAFKIVEEPVITSVLPRSIIQGGEDRILDINGRGFKRPGSVVTINAPGVILKNTAIIGTEKIRVTIDVDEGSSIPGFYDIVIDNPDGSSGTGVSVLEIKEPPTPPVLQNLSPDKMDTGTREQNIVISGDNFQEGIVVSFGGGGIEVSSVNYRDQAQIIVSVNIADDAVIGARDVTLSNPDGGLRTYADEFEVTTVPVITQVSPSVITKADVARIIPSFSIGGRGFIKGSSVEISGGGIEVTTVTYVGATQLEVEVVVYSTAAEGFHDIIVNSPYGSQGKGFGLLTILEAMKVDNTPIVKVPQEVVNRVISIKGNGFGEEAIVVFSGGGIDIEKVKVLSNKEMEVTISVASEAKLGERKVTVKNIDGSSATSELAVIEIVPPIKVGRVEPRDIGIGVSSATLRIIGSGFKAGASVEISGMQSDIIISSVTVLSSREILAQVEKVSENASLGYRDVVVINSIGEKGIGHDLLQVIEAIKVDHLKPSYVVIGNAKTVNIIGDGFELVNGSTPAVIISGAGVSVSSVTFENSAVLKATFTVSANAQLGLRTVTVTNGDGSLGKGLGVFEVVKPLELHNVKPDKLGIGAINQKVEVNGSGFVKGASVKFENSAMVEVKNVEYISSEQLYVRVDIANTTPVGSYDATVINPNGEQAQKVDALEIDGSPAINKVSPSALSEGAVDQTVVIEGFNLITSTKVSFGDPLIIVSSPTVYSSRITVVVNILKGVIIGEKTLTVTTTGGTFGRGRDLFEVTPAPKVKESNPNVIERWKTDIVVDIYGTGFKPGIKAEFDDSSLKITSTVYKSPELLTLTLDSTNAEIRSYDLKVINPDGSTGIGESIITVQMPPIVNACSPNRLSRGTNDQDITISGSNFMDGAIVSFSGGGIFITSTTFVDVGAIKVRVSIEEGAEVGARTVTITNPNGSNSRDTGLNKFEVTPRPVITNLDPSSLMRGTSSWIKIQGTGFYGITGIDPVVSFSGDGILITSTVYNSMGEMKVKIHVDAAATTGQRDVIIRNADNSIGTGENMFSVVAPIKITDVAPNRIPQGASNRSLTITGEGFLEFANVKFGGSGIEVRQVDWKNENQLAVVIDVAIDAPIEGREVIVTNANGTTSSANGLFDIVAPIIVEKVEPKEIGAGITDKEVIIKGSGFVGGLGAEVKVSGTGVTVTTVSYSSTQIGVKISVDEDAIVGDRDVTVINPDNNEGVGSKLITVVNKIGISEVSPRYITKGSTVSVRIIGTGFSIETATPTISLSGTGIDISSVTYVSTTELTMYIIVYSTAHIGARDIKIKNADGTVGRADGILEITEALKISRLEPNNIGKGATGEVISLYGTGFVAASDVKFTLAGITVTKIEYISHEQLKLTISVASSAIEGPSAVIITNPNTLPVTKASAFTVTKAPVVTSIAPAQIAQGAVDQDITVTGANIQDSTSTKVEISGTGITISSTVVIGETSLRMTISVAKTAAVGARDIVVTNPVDIISGTAPYGIGKGLLNIVQGPVITAISPNNVDQGSNKKEIYITGKGFQQGIKVEVNALGVTILDQDVTYISPERIRVLVTVDVGAPTGLYDVKVTNPDGSSDTLPSVFSITPPPQVTAVGTPIVSRGDTNRLIDIIGANFEDGASVFIEDMNIVEVSFISSVKLSVRVNVPADAREGLKDVRVTNPNGSIGIGEDLIEILEQPPLLKSVTTSGTSIDYEKYINSSLATGVTFYYEITETANMELSINKVLQAGAEQLVTRMTLNSVPIGKHTTDYLFYWDGSIEYTKGDDSTGYRKVNGDYSYTLKATSSKATEQITSNFNQKITVDVVNLSNTYVEYTIMGADKEKVAPYILHYHLSKEAYTDIEIKDSSQAVVRKFSIDLAKQGENKKIWDGRNNNGVRVSKGLYVVTIKASDNSNPKDEADSKEINVSVDSLKVFDVTVGAIKDQNAISKISLTASETMRVDIKIYKPGTIIKVYNPAPEKQNFSAVYLAPGEVEVSDPSALVKSFNIFLEKGTTYQVEWDGKNERGDMLIDGDYPFVITGRDSHGVVMSEPYLGVIAIERAHDHNMRNLMFKNNGYAYPNPVDGNKRSSINIHYGINRVADLHLYIYDIIGNLVWDTHINNVPASTEGDIVWPLVNNRGSKVARGVYIYILEADESQSGEKLKTINKIMVIK
ncbi:IPT/TIG domain-containing protein [bacterium]